MAFKRKVVVWLPVVLWAMIIFWFSAQSHPPDVGRSFPFKRKLEHMAGYAVFGLLVLRALRKGHGLPLKKAAALAIVLVAAYASSDEWHQSFVPYRDPEVTDVMIDTFGGGIAIGCCLGYESRRSPKTNR
jgi:VanZ family protein